jgi:hypothetical protein
LTTLLYFIHALVIHCFEFCSYCCQRKEIPSSFLVVIFTVIMAGGTKRMSAEEKRKTILGIYHSTKQVYTEKEILALAAKAGVNANT